VPALPRLTPPGQYVKLRRMPYDENLAGGELVKMNKKCYKVQVVGF